MYIVQYTIQVQYSINSIYNTHQYHIPYIAYIHYTYTYNNNNMPSTPGQCQC